LILSGAFYPDLKIGVWRRERIKSLARGGSIFEGDLRGDDVLSVARLNDYPEMSTPSLLKAQIAVASSSPPRKGRVRKH
jgi:hypothetical protein